MCEIRVGQVPDLPRLSSPGRSGTCPTGLICAILMSGVLDFGQVPSKPSVTTVLDGVFTEAQAAKGKAAYATYCSMCHRADLGGFSGPPLVGELFMDRWREFNLSVLFDLIVTTMP